MIYIELQYSIESLFLDLKTYKLMLSWLIFNAKFTRNKTE